MIWKYNKKINLKQKINKNFYFFLNTFEMQTQTRPNKWYTNM